MNIQAITIPLTHLVLSQTPMQQERRKHRTEKDIKELAESMASVKQIHPIVVRPDPMSEIRRSDDGAPLYEIVAGEGRYLAAEEAGITALRAEVRDLTDEQVEEIQLIENLQRTGLHELVEAEGYEALQKRGHSVDEIAVRTGKSKATIYARLKLLDLCPDARKALRDGKVSASIALLLARIPVEDLQKKALEHILQPRAWNPDPMSYRDAAEYVQREFTLRLTEAPFPRDDAGLVAGAGTCGACPKRTGNQPELFGDVKSADVCTDPKCFSAKRAAWNKLQLAKAKETGKPIITGAEAKKINRKPYYGPDAPSLSHGYVRPADKCPEDPKGRSYAELLGKGADGVLLQNPDTGSFSKAFKREDIASALKAKHGITLKKDPEPVVGQQSTYNERDNQIEKLFRLKVIRAIFDKSPKKASRGAMVYLIARELESTDTEHLFEALGWKFPGYGKVEDHVAKLSDSDLNRLMHIAPFWHQLGHWGDAKDLLAQAKTHKVNTKELRNQAIIETEPKTAPASEPAKASTKKKAARKSK